MTKNILLKMDLRKLIKKHHHILSYQLSDLKEAPLPCFNNGWEERALSYGEGITVLYSDQCPIMDYAIKNIYNRRQGM